MTHAPQARRELENHLINRALRDDAFRRRLIADPKGAVRGEIERLQLAISLPEGLKIRVLEESPDTLYLILPPDLIGKAAPEDDFFLEALRTLQSGTDNNEPSQAD